jgi:hypothetical protein
LPLNYWRGCHSRSKDGSQTSNESKETHFKRNGERVGGIIGKERIEDRFAIDNRGISKGLYTYLLSFTTWFCQVVQEDKCTRLV